MDIPTSYRICTPICIYKIRLLKPAQWKSVQNRAWLVAIPIYKRKSGLRWFRYSGKASGPRHDSNAGFGCDFEVSNSLEKIKPHNSKASKRKNLLFLGLKGLAMGCRMIFRFSEWEKGRLADVYHLPPFRPVGIPLSYPPLLGLFSKDLTSRH